MLRTKSIHCVIIGLAMLSGCNSDSDAPQENGPSDAGQAFILSAEPEGATDVIAARESAEDEADLVVVGRIGGDVNPWVDDMAAFTIVDNSLPACNDIEGDECPTPWDYCCATGVADGRMLVKFVDEDGNPVETDARELLGLKELDTVVVQGTAQRDEDGNLTILASNVFVRPETERPKVPASAHTHSHENGHSHDHDDADDHEHSPADESEDAEGEHSHADEDHEHSHEGVEIEHSHDAESESDDEVIDE